MAKSERKRLNLKGYTCPYPFQKTILALEKLNVGEELEIVIDYAPAAVSVPRMLKVYGHEVTEIVKTGSRWVISIRKGKAPV